MTYRNIMAALLWVGLVTTAASAQWWCAFNPLAEGCPTSEQETKEDRTELCDTPIPASFQLIYGPPPVGAGCLSRPDKVEYYTTVQSFVPGSESLFEGEAANVFKEFGFGTGLKYTRSWGAYKRPLIGFPEPEWGRPIPVVFGRGAERWPMPYVSRAQTDAIKAGACIANVAVQVPGRYQELNAANCKED